MYFKIDIYADGKSVLSSLTRYVLSWDDEPDENEADAGSVVIVFPMNRLAFAEWNSLPDVEEYSVQISYYDSEDKIYYHEYAGDKLCLSQIGSDSEDCSSELTLWYDTKQQFCCDPKALLQ